MGPKKNDRVDSTFEGIVKAMGLVFGDIGTSPIYTLAVVFMFIEPTPQNVMGILSLVIWTLLVLVTAEYAWLAMSLSKKGEGGSIVMREILIPLLKSSRKYVFFTILTFVGVSLLIGDGVITPAISILSAVEGMTLIPGLEGISQTIIVMIAALIAIWLFSFQKHGSDRVSKSFGPIMLIWFSVLAISGIVSIVSHPSVIEAFNPFFALSFLFSNGIAGFFILSEVVLCATGGEALYADMGHLGRKPIMRAWSIVFFALILNYLGQGVFAMQHPEAGNIFFGMLLSQTGFLYVPLVILAIMATVIASQAMISGMFSVVYQGINTGLLPKLRIEYTSVKLKSQIYIPLINWALLVTIILMMLFFGSSANLSNAYGLAVTGSMTATGIMMTVIFYLKKKRLKTVFAACVTIIDFIYLASTMMKIPMGGFWSLAISAVPFTIVSVYMLGQKRLAGAIRPITIDSFLPRYEEYYKSAVKIPGTALFFTKHTRTIPQYISRVMFDNGIIYQNNILLSIVQKDEPYGIDYGFKEPLGLGLRHFQIDFGYMEVLDVGSILTKAKLDQRVIFYGQEEIKTKNPFWKIYSIIKRLATTSVRFYKLPAEKLHGVVVRVEFDRGDLIGEDPEHVGPDS